MTSHRPILQRFFCVCALFFAMTASKAQTGAIAKSFEGVLQIQIQDWQSVEMVNYYIKNERARIESVPSNPDDPYFIVDNASKKIFVIRTDKDSYMELPLERQPYEKSKGDSATISITKVEGEETILGFSCEHWMLKEDQMSTDIWATRTFNTGLALDLKRTTDTNVSSRWKDELASRGLFPLKLVQQDENGTEVYKVEVLKIQRKSVNEMLFRVPEGYEKIEKPLVKKPIKK